MRIAEGFMQAKIQTQTFEANRCHPEPIPLRASGQALPLFCIHDGNFEQLASAMPEDQPVYGLRPLTLDGAELNLNLEQIAAHYLRQICSVQPHGPYQLAGYSIGALLAYEVATQLANRGERISLLAMMDSRAEPKFHQSLSPAERKRFRRTYLADRIRKYSKNLRQGRFDDIWSDASQYIGKIKPLAWKLTQRACEKLGFPTPSFMRSRHVLFSLILRSYTLKEFEGRVVLLRPEVRPPEEDLDPCFGWQKYAKEGVDVQFVPGDHQTMMLMPNTLVLAKKLVPYLQLSKPNIQI
jgi:thioesterase domain-containing protein